jgi:hypothetical protein
MPDLYITVDVLKNAALDNEADNTPVWELLAESVSRLFDRECEVSDGFFSKAGDEVSLRSYRGNNTQYLKLFPYIPDSITIISIDGDDYYDITVSQRRYRERDGYLIFNYPVSDTAFIDVTAIYGFAAIAADIKQACIEQALQLWRKKDLGFCRLSGISAAAINAEFSPTFTAVTKRYRELYSANTFFS